MGTPLPPEYRKPDGSAYLSGTEWEYLDALDAAKRCGRPEILVYRRTEKCLLDPDDAEFDEKLRQRQQCRGLLRRLPQSGRLDPQRLQRIRGAGGLRPATRPASAHGDQPAAAGANRPISPPSAAAAPAASAPAAAVAGLALSRPARLHAGRRADLLRPQPRDRRAGGAGSPTGCRFLAVVGASGSGKSSLVAAGLVAAAEGQRHRGCQGLAAALRRRPLRGERKQWVGPAFHAR